MQGAADKYTPEIQMLSLTQAEEKRDQLEKTLQSLNEQWEDCIGEIQSQTENFMSTNEIEEFQSRINVLVRELNDKNLQIENVQAEKQELMKTKNKQGELNIEIEEHRGEITSLNQRYTSALKDKVSVYVELVNSVKELKKRHQKFFTNELQLVQL